MAAPLDIATIGDNCIDRYLPPVDAATIGGNAVNVAVHLARKGHRVAYFGAIGTDAAGERMRVAFARNRLDLGGLQVRGDRPTAHTDIATDAAGERSILFEEFGACAGYRPTEADIAHLLRKRHVHIGWLDDGGALKRRLAAGGISVSQDLGVNTDPRHASAEGLSIAFASAGSAMNTACDLIRESLGRGARLAIVTCGPLGSIAGDGARTITQLASPANILDTTGAGDSFIAGFLDAHLGGATLEAALHAGAMLAAETCTHLGGFPQEPIRPARSA